MRIAFLTPEFVTEYRAAGGLASYLDRMTQALVDQGHEVEVFTLAAAEKPEVVIRRGVRIHRVVEAPHYGFRLVERLAALHYRTKLATTIPVLPGALALARSFHSRDRASPFDLVQSADYLMSGLFVRRHRGRVHLIRCSWAPELYNEADGVPSRFDTRVRFALERLALRRADGVYAPSRFVADHLTKTNGIPARVVRPPLPVFPARPAKAAAELPPKYLIHFGQIGARKGSDVIARALTTAWRTAPDLTMVWAGKQIHRRSMDQYRGLWGERSERVQWLGSVARNQLLGIVAGSVAAVLPSRVDNLPNTVIECLSLGVPVIGSAGASIDELVVDGVDGELVPVGDEAALAEALVRAWRGLGRWNREVGPRSSTLSEMAPERAVAALLDFAAECRGRSRRSPAPNVRMTSEAATT